MEGKSMIVMHEKLQEIMDELKTASAETFYHSIHVKNYVYKMIKLMNQDGFTAYTSDEIDSICKGILLHDVGKLYIRNAILTKNSRLTDEEMVSMSEHPRLGYEAIKLYLNREEHDIIKNICLYHHERCDGNGYEGKTELPLYVQIVAICDSYDALTADRVYREALDSAVAVDMIEKGNCGAFDEKIIDYLKKIID